MRIATAQMFQTGVKAMLDLERELSKTQQQLATGRRVVDPADDPSATVKTLELERMRALTDQYQRNGTRADARLDLEETTLAGATNLLQRVRELAVRANNDSLGAAERDAIATEVRLQLDGLLALANTRDASDEYLFAGYQTATQPFVDNGGGSFSYQGDQGQRFLQIGSSRQVAVGDPGSDVFMNIPTSSGARQDVFATLYNFVTDLQANNPNPNTITDIELAMDTILNTRTKAGARLNAVEDQAGVNDAFQLETATALSEVQDLDYAEAVGRLNQQLLALQASQQSFIKVQGLSLFDYL